MLHQRPNLSQQSIHQLLNFTFLSIRDGLNKIFITNGSCFIVFYRNFLSVWNISDILDKSEDLQNSCNNLMIVLKLLESLCDFCVILMSLDFLSFQSNGLSFINWVFEMGPNLNANVTRALFLNNHLHPSGYDTIDFCSNLKFFHYLQLKYNNILMAHGLKLSFRDQILKLLHFGLDVDFPLVKVMDNGLQLVVVNVPILVDGFFINLKPLR